MPTGLELIDFEDAHPRHDGLKEEAIRHVFGITPARYYLLLDRAIDTPEAEQARPMIVHRLRRLRDFRARERHRRTG